MARAHRVVVARVIPNGSRSADPATDDSADSAGDSLARSLRDAGCEVILIGIPAVPGIEGADRASRASVATFIAEAVLQEDASAVWLPVGASTPDRADLPADLPGELVVELASRGLEDVVVFTGESDDDEIVDRFARGLGVDGDS